MLRCRIIQASAVAALLLHSATAGTLDDFEEKAERRPKKKKESRPKHYDDYDSFGSGTYPSESVGNSFLESVWVWMISSPFVYQHDDPSAGLLTGEDLYAEMLEIEETDAHRPGMFVLPYVRADYNWQYINATLDAQEMHLELGYKALAFHGRHTRYSESDPSDYLDINQYYGLLRFAGVALDDGYPVRSWEMHIGGGVVHQRGNSEHSGGAVTVPILIYPTDWLGLEFRPAWYRPQARTIGDYDLSASLGWNYIHVRFGYRWLWMQGEGTWLNGPYSGVSLSF